MCTLSLIAYFIIAALWILEQVRSRLSSTSARRVWSMMTFEESCCHSGPIMNMDMTKDRWVGSEAVAPPRVAPPTSLAMQQALIGRRLADLEGPPRVWLTWITQDGAGACWRADEQSAESRVYRVVGFVFWGVCCCCFLSVCELLWICFTRLTFANIKSTTI